MNRRISGIPMADPPPKSCALGLATDRVSSYLSRMSVRVCLFVLLGVLLSSAQDDPSEPLLVKPNLPLPEATGDESATPDEKKADAATSASVFNQGKARTMTISIPAPRGLILDREGRPLAQTKMAYHLALDFTAYQGPADPDAAVAWAQEQIVAANDLVNGDQSYSDEELASYFRYRRWLPKMVSQILSEEKAKTLESQLPRGLTLLPVYQRYYPEKSLAAHLIGYVGAKTVLPNGPINDGDPLFKSVMGKTGFEMIFDDKLSGTPGLKKLIFDEKGTKILDELVARPRPGGNVVTTIDLDWQRYAERVLREDSKRGAFVVIDILTGEVLVMASRPTYDLNEFVPYITTERYRELEEDPSGPLFGRAFQSAYPPASTFKPVVALAAINNGAIRPDEKFNCPYKIKIGNKWFRNHSAGHQGWVDAKRALAKSINPWFYQVGIRTGPQAFLSVARRLGYGSKTGLPLVGETAGIAPTPEYIESRMGRRTTDGDTANLSIGQGLVTASPLQVARSMAAIGNGSVLMELQLIRQIQDFHGRVMEAPTFKSKNDLELSSVALDTTRAGMRNVVHAGYGTGRRADLGFTIMCGKTGTAQWKPAIEQNLAWFSGFFPYDDPRYAFAVVYEGTPGESVSGGRNAAPMVRRFFRNFRSEIKENLESARAEIVLDDGDAPAPDNDEGIPRAIVVEDDTIPKALVVEEAGATPADSPLPPENAPPVPSDLPTVPGEEEIPQALPVPPDPEAPADQPRQPPVAPADQ